MIFDTHTHYDDKAFDADRSSILGSLRENGIGHIINASADLSGISTTVTLSEAHEFIYAAVGVHPDASKELNEDNFLWLSEMAKRPKVVAIGEIGLDYYWDASDRGVQKLWFERQLRLATELELPVVIHSREAAEDTLSIIVNELARVKRMHKQLRGVMHCYSYSLELAREYLKMGFFLGIGGVVTFKNAKKLKAVVAEAPLDRLLLETDCPYLAPEPFRGKRNQSSYLAYVAEEIARLKNCTAAEVIELTEKNAVKLFNIPI